MKRITAIFLAAAMAGTALVGCSHKPQTEESSAPRVSTAPIDEAILGEWSSGANGYIFSDDRTVSLPIDFTSSAHFNSDGSFSMESTKVGREEIEFDGTNLKVSHKYEEAEGDETLVLLDMKRTGAENKDSYDGEYELLGGTYRDMLAYNLAIDTDKIDVLAEVDGETFKFTVRDYCYFETNDGTLELFSENMNYVKYTDDSVKYTYTVDGDTLTLTYEDGAQEVLKKVK
ncbi:MAG: hypothetical protein Q4A05_04645 [Ruminococcus sp.]|nr:hypothetical protein [Ruminococcus sp.]